MTHIKMVQESCQRRQSATFRARGALDKRRWSQQRTMPIRELLQEVNAHGKAERHMKLLTIETESRLGTLWDQEQCTQFCSKDELWEAAKEEEKKIPWKDANEGPPVSEEHYQERFWRRRLDGIGLDTATKEFLAIEFKRTQDVRSNYVEKATAVAQEKYKSLLTVLQAVGQLKGWEVQPGVRRRDVRIRSC